MSYVTWYNDIYIESTCLLFVLMVGFLHYLYSLHADFYTSENIINIERLLHLFLIQWNVEDKFHSSVTCQTLDYPSSTV